MSSNSETPLENNTSITEKLEKLSLLSEHVKKEIILR